ncbi:glycine betaine ABC transporter substrate-binding protein [Nocardia sp. NPDC058176]|uniref:glycine betaine ABC transporter substrate-binding protein n=1 Tax=Nocardia sp. NPDC058176 TaxID=3346368 RepID=UPI0036D90957
MSSRMVPGALRRSAAAILVATCSLAAVACADDDARAVVAVGADSSTESVLLAEIYSQALSRTGTDTTVLTGLDTPTADLDAGRIAVLPARNGSLLDRWNPSAAARAPEDVLAAVNAALPQGLSVSDAADGTDLRPRLLVTEDFATRENLRTVAALTCPELTAGYTELPGLAPTAIGPDLVADCAFAATSHYPDTEALRNALRDGQIQVGIVNGPPTGENPADLITLDDEDYALRTQNILALHRTGIFDRRQTKKLNYVAGELTTEELIDLITQVESGAAPAIVARTWLDDHGL